MRANTRKNRRNSMKRSGGAATVMPLQYFNPMEKNPSASPGHNLLEAQPPLGIRPKIGGGGKRRLLPRKSYRRNSKNKKTTGGFVPSVMGNFVASASKYIVPLALFAGYKLMTRKAKKTNRRTRRR
jgi:hypothetical protein